MKHYHKTFALAIFFAILLFQACVAPKPQVGRVSQSEQMALEAISQRFLGKRQSCFMGFARL